MRLNLAVIALAMAGCSSGPAPEPPKPPEPVSGLSAFYKMFVTARSWAADAEPLRIAEIDVDEVTTGDGRAAAWEAVFVSPGNRQMQRCIFSVVNRPARNLRGGLHAEPPEGWSGSAGIEPFLVQAFKTDSTTAYEVAMKKAGPHVKKNTARFVLEKTRRFPNPAWRVFWGESVSLSGYSVFVDATTGEYLATGR